VTYYRMSDDKQENSIGRQKSQVEPYAARQGYTITREYLDEAISGSEERKRKEFLQMLQDLQKRGAPRVILCDDKDRFSRFDSIDYGYYVKPLRDAGVKLITVAQGVVDWSSFAGRIADAVLQEARNLEQEAISRRVLSSQLLKAQTGGYTGGPAPYGYRWEPLDPPRLVPDGHKAEVVRLIFRLYDGGRTLYAISEELRCRGVPSPRGRNGWTRSVLQRLLTNRRYVGDWTWGVHPQGKRHRYASGALQPSVRGERLPRKNPAHAWLVLPDHHEALVSRDLFERVQARLAGNQTATAPQGGGGPFVLNRMLVCGHCGSFLRGLTSYGQRIYVCGGYLAYGKSTCNRNSIPEEPLVKLILRELQRKHLDPEHLDALEAEYAQMTALEQSPENLNRLQKRAEDLKDKIRDGNERLLILPTDRLPGVIEQLRQWEKEREALLAELHRIAKDSPANRLNRTKTRIQELLWGLQEALQSEGPSALRQALRENIARVELRWTHHRTGGVTRCRFKEGLIVPQASEELSQLSPSAGR
jgi:DNA invertase Pin-like site-specific DNA recombinase